MTLEWSSSYGPVDEDFADVSLLIKGEGTNGSTTILDSSSNNLSISVLGNPGISTAVNTPFGTGDGVLLWPSGGSGNRIEVQYDSNFLFNQDLTAELWFYPTNNTNNLQELITIGTFTNGFVIRLISPFNDDTYIKGQAFNISPSVNFNSWNHVSLVRNGNTAKVYVNGISLGVERTVTGTVNDLEGIVTIGKSYFGYISNVRITKGVARYTENFDVPTAPFPILSPSTRIEVGDGFDVEAANYILAVEAADAAAGQSGGLEPAVRTAINDFVVGCKSDGIWNAIKASCLLSGARTLEGALVPLKGVAPTNFNFTLSDYDRELGLLGNGSTKYLNSNQANDGLPQDSIHLSFYIRSLPSVLTALAFTSYGSTPTGLFLSTSNTFEFYLNSLRLSTGIASSTGFVGASRSASNTSLQRVNGTEIPSSVASGTRKTDSIYIFNDASGASTYASNARIAFYSIGESLDLALLDTRISDFITAIGVAIP